MLLTQATAESVARVPEDGGGLVTMLQSPPAYCSTTPWLSLLMPVEVAPTAQQSSALTQVTLERVSPRPPDGVGLTTILQPPAVYCSINPWVSSSSAVTDPTAQQSSWLMQATLLSWLLLTGPDGVGVETALQPDPAYCSIKAWPPALLGDSEPTAQQSSAVAQVTPERKLPRRELAAVMPAGTTLHDFPV
jgi:hypothetical protein